MICDVEFMAVWIGFLIIAVICLAVERLVKRHKEDHSQTPGKLSEEKLYSAADLYLLKTGDTPPKASVQRNFSVTGKEVYFELPGDFIEFNSHRSGLVQQKRSKAQSRSISKTAQPAVTLLN